MAAYKESHYRSIAKAASYRILASIATATVVFIFTGRIVLSIGVGLVESVVKIICYYIHERMWSFVKIGKIEHPLSSLHIKKPLGEKDILTKSCKKS